MGLWSQLNKFIGRDPGEPLDAREVNRFTDATTTLNMAPKYTPSEQQQNPNLLLKEMLGGESLIAIDVGGANDLQPHWARLVGVAQFVIYEPHEQSYRALIARQDENQSYRAFRYLNEALSGTGGQRNLYQTNVPTGSSLIPPKKGGFGDHARNTYFWPLTVRSIPTLTMANHKSRKDRSGRCNKAGYPRYGARDP